MQRFEGTVTKIEPSTSWVDAGPDGRFRCELRAKVSRRANERLAVGDRVVVSHDAAASEQAKTGAGPLVGDARTGMIEEILPRKTVLRRPRSYKREQILCANVDQIVLVLAAFDPPYKRNFVDRVLVAIERDELSPVLVFNKLDLADQAYREVVEEDAAVYVALGYKVVGTSTVTGEGIDDLRAILKDRISAVAGPSGVGKSTLLNKAVPGLHLKTGDVQEGTGRGKHTTTSAELVPLSSGGFVVDTPGIKAFGLWDMEPRELAGFFPELRALKVQCRFGDCSHREEPGCGVIEAVESGEIDEERYESYKKLRGELEAEEATQKALREALTVLPRKAIEKKVQEGLESDERWKIIVRKNNWLCPYCGKIGARELKMDEAIEAKIADHFATSCDRWKDFETDPLPIDRLRLRAKLLVFKSRVARWVQDDRRFRLVDDERRWLCPYCAEETAVQAPDRDLDDPQALGNAPEDDAFIDSAARHLLECADFARGEDRVRALRDLEERRARLTRRGREDRLRERFRNETAFRIADGERRWLCPFCATPTEARLAEGKGEPDDTFFETVERHLLLCKAYQVLEGKPRSVEELRGKLQKDVRSSRLTKVREKIKKHAIWRARDVEGSWYCPYCATPSEVRFPSDRSDEAVLDRFVGRVIEHLGTCSAYKEKNAQIKSKAHMADVIARANSSSSLRKIFRAKLVEDRLFAVTDEVDNWACPYCKKVQKAIHIYPMTETAVFDKTVEQVVLHLEEECESYTPDAPPRCTRDELERIARPGTSLRSSGITDARILQKPLGQSGEYYARLKKDLDEVKSKMEIVGRRQQSMKEARSKQLRLLPAIPVLPDYEFGCVYRPCDDVGGDFYDFIKVDEGRIGLAIGDIAGHGIEAALLMGLAKKLLEVHGRGRDSASEALCLANQDIFPDLDEKTFVTVFYGVLDTRTRILRFSRAGHNPLVLFNPKRRPVLQVHDSKGMALGMDSGQIFRESIEELELELRPGDLLFQYTDGVSEAMNPKGEEFGLERVTRVIEEWGQNEAEYVLWRIEKAVDEWLEGAPPKDDITMFAVRVLG